jgi:hypothetical protein
MLLYRARPNHIVCVQDSHDILNRYYAGTIFTILPSRPNKASSIECTACDDILLKVKKKDWRQYISALRIFKAWFRPQFSLEGTGTLNIFVSI